MTSAPQTHCLCADIAKEGRKCVSNEARAQLHKIWRKCGAERSRGAGRAVAGTYMWHDRHTELYQWVHRPSSLLHVAVSLQITNRGRISDTLYSVSIDESATNNRTHPQNLYTITVCIQTHLNIGQINAFKTEVAFVWTNLWTRSSKLFESRFHRTAWVAIDANISSYPKPSNFSSKKSYCIVPARLDKDSWAFNATNNY